MEYKIIFLVFLIILLLFFIFMKFNSLYDILPIILVFSISTFLIPYLGIDLLNGWIKSPYYAYLTLFSILIIFYVCIYPVSDSLHFIKSILWK